MVKLPWIPVESEWLQLLETFRPEPIRNRLMLALAYDSALRREELCSLRTDDFDPAHRTLRVRAETTKTRRERVVPYSASTGVLLADYLRHRSTLSRARGPRPPPVGSAWEFDCLAGRDLVGDRAWVAGDPGRGGVDLLEEEVEGVGEAG